MALQETGPLQGPWTGGRAWGYHLGLPVNEDCGKSQCAGLCQWICFQPWWSRNEGASRSQSRDVMMQVRPMQGRLVGRAGLGKPERSAAPAALQRGHLRSPRHGSRAHSPPQVILERMVFAFPNQMGKGHWGPKTLAGSFQGRTCHGCDLALVRSQGSPSFGLRLVLCS